MGLDVESDLETRLAEALAAKRAAEQALASARAHLRSVLEEYTAALGAAPPALAAPPTVSASEATPPSVPELAVRVVPAASPPLPPVPPTAPVHQFPTSARGAFLHALHMRPGEEVTIEQMHAASGVDPQALRDAGRRAVSDPSSGVRRVRPGVFVFRSLHPAPAAPSAARATSTAAVDPVGARNARKSPSVTRKVDEEIVAVLREANRPLAARDIVADVQRRVGSAVDSHFVTNRLFVLSRDGVLAKWGETRARRYGLRAKEEATV